jgi:formylglycine-generating enzyme
MDLETAMEQRSCEATKLSGKEPHQRAVAGLLSLRVNRSASSSFLPSRLRVFAVRSTGVALNWWLALALTLGFAAFAADTNRPPDSHAPTNMVLIPAGSFAMGDSFHEGRSDELPVHTVYVSAFHMDKFEVTKALWYRVHDWATNHGYKFENRGAGKWVDHPVHSINWYDAVKWCNARSEKEGLVPAYYTSPALDTVYRKGRSNLVETCVKWGTGYRLPTEAEWEKAARGGVSGRRYPWADTNRITQARANFYSNGGNQYRTGPMPYTSPAGSFPPNGYGLFDMAGNIKEWCWDAYYDGWYSHPGGTEDDPRGPMDHLNNRVLRGGSWFNGTNDSRCAAREGRDANFFVNDYAGFRCVIGLSTGRLPGTASHRPDVRRTEPPSWPHRVERLAYMTIEERLPSLAWIERNDPKAVDAIALLKQWATNTPPHELHFLAEALCERGNRFLMPAMRERWRLGIFDDPELLLEYGEAEDYGLLRDAEEQRSHRGEEYSSVGYSRFAFRLAKLLRLGRSDAVPLTNWNIVPLLVDSLEFQQPWDEFVLGGRQAKYSAADLALDALVRMTGHNEGFEPTTSPTKRWAATARWKQWWQKEGETAFLAKHPETKPAFGGVRYKPRPALDVRTLPLMVSVRTADPVAPIGYGVPRSQVISLLGAGRIQQEGAERGLRFRFTSHEAESNWWAEAHAIFPGQPYHILGNEHLQGPFLEGSNRVWLWQGGPQTNDPALRRHIEDLFTHGGETVILSNATIVLLDRNGGLWVQPYLQTPRRGVPLTSRPLWAYDPKTRQWMTREPAAIQVSGQVSNQFYGTAFESRRGGLCFADHYGVHMLHGSNWTYQAIFEPEARALVAAGRKPLLRPPEFAEDAEGRTYCWVPRRNLDYPNLPRGYWLFDGRSWTHNLAVDYIQHLIPRPGGEVWAICQSNRFYVVSTNGQVLSGEAARRRAFLNPNLGQPLFVGTDPTDRTILILTDLTGTTNTPAVVFPPAGRPLELGTELGKALWNKEAGKDMLWGPSNTMWTIEDVRPPTANPQASRPGNSKGLIIRDTNGVRLRAMPLPPDFGTSPHGLDHQGRVYFYTRSNFCRLDSQATDLLESADTQVPTLGVSSSAGPWADSLGRIWFTCYTPVLMDQEIVRLDGLKWESVFQPEKSEWKGPDSSTIVVPGANGAMFFLRSPGFGVSSCALVDDQGLVFDAIGALVQKYPARVRAALPVLPRDLRGNFAKDKAGNVWWADDQIHVLNGATQVVVSAERLGLNKWPRGRLALVLLGDGSRAWAGGEERNALLEFANGEIVKVADAPRVTGKQGWFPQPALRDQKGRVWLDLRDGAVALAPDGTVVATNAYCPCLEDRQGGLWFPEFNGPRSQVMRLGLDGRGSRVSFWAQRLCEAPDGTVWILTSSDLVQFSVSTSGIKVLQTLPVPRAEAGVERPIACDRDGRIWIRGAAYAVKSAK